MIKHKKILTISIAAYNAEKYIGKLLKNICIDEIIDKLEIIVINDGSIDKTFNIVEQYKKKYPNSIIQINKSNGGWGSTLNKSVKIATGKYFKVVDADDLIDNNGMLKLLNFLTENNVDAVVTQAVRFNKDGYKEKIFQCFPVVGNKQYKIEDVVQFADIAIWGYTFLTSIVKEYFQDLPTNMFYTDRIFLVDILRGIGTIQYLDIVTYYYRVGTIAQSTSIENIKKHYNESIIVDNICLYKCNQVINSGVSSVNYILNRMAYYYGHTLDMLLRLPCSGKNLKILIKHENHIKSECYVIYELTSNLIKKVRYLRKSRYLIYWLVPIMRKLRLIK